MLCRDISGFFALPNVLLFTHFKQILYLPLPNVLFPLIPLCLCLFQVARFDVELLGEWDRRMRQVGYERTAYLGHRRISHFPPSQRTRLDRLTGCPASFPSHYGPQQKKTQKKQPFNHSLFHEWGNERSERMSERYERMDEQVAQCFSLYFWLLWPTVYLPLFRCVIAS